MKSFPLILISSLLLASCAPATLASTPQLLTVYATSAAGPWLTELYGCSAGSSIILSRVMDEGSAEIILRVGEPQGLVTPAYEIDSEEILIVAHRESPVQNLGLEEARALFAGQGDPSVQVWVYSSGEDVQQIFDQAVMQGRSVTSFARLAADPQQMADVLNVESNAVGILPRHWKMGNTREVYSAGSVPVLAITKTEPAGALRNLIACLQK